MDRYVARGVTEVQMLWHCVKLLKGVKEVDGSKRSLDV